MDSIQRKPPGYAAANDVLDEVLTRARAAAAEGLVPRRPLDQCLRALNEVLTFISSQKVLRAEPALSADTGRAVLRVAQELESPSKEPLVVELPLSVEHEEAIRTGVLLLSAYRAAVRMSCPSLSQAMATEFGLDGELRMREGGAVADGISRFLAAAVRHSEVVQAASLSARQLAGLEAQERVLRAHIVQRKRQAVTHGLPERVRILHLVLEHFLNRFEAALGARLPELMGQPTYRACHLSDSGRLVFSS